MASWAEVGQGISNSSGLLGIPTSAVSFDTTADLLWTGSAQGGVTSHYGLGLQRYTNWPAHPSSNARAQRNPYHGAGSSGGSGVKGLLCDERAVYSVGEGGIKASLRRGLVRWNLFTAESEHPDLNLASMCFSPAASSDIVAGGASSTALKTGKLSSTDDVILSINSGTGSIIRKEAAEAQLAFLRRSSRYICAGSSDGHIQLRDPRTLRIQHRLHAHPGGLIDMQADGDQLYTVGWTIRLGHPVPEPIVKVHDLRTMRPLVPIPFSSAGGPAFLAVHPKRSSTVIVAAPSGQFQIVDVSNLGDATFHQINVSSYLTSMAISQSSDFLAFGEADGTVRLWAASGDAAHFTSFSPDHVETADAPEPPPVVNWTTETSLSKIGMPYYDDPLLSAMPYDEHYSEASPLFNPPKKIDPAVLGAIRTVDKVSYAPLPRHLRQKRNVIEGAGPGGASAGSAARTRDRRRPEERRRIGAPLFRSEKEAARRQANNAGDDDDDGSASLDQDASSLPSGSNGQMPSYYQLKTIEYSKFGVEDFDFEFYNRTPFSGLETHIENSYANAYLQALHYLVPFRAVAEAHALESAPIDSSRSGCMRDDCLLCQAGFLFKMLEDARGANCQATNFLRAVSVSPRAASLGLMDKEDSHSSDAAYSSLIQTFNRFMLDTVSAEAGEAIAPRGQTLVEESKDRLSAVDVMAKLFSSTVLTKQSCGICGHESARESTGRIVDLVYPRKALSNEPSPPSDFASVLRASLLRETVTKTMCRGCHAPAAPIKSSRVLAANEALPQALSVNCNVNTGEQLRYWMVGTNGETYVPPMIAIDVSKDGKASVSSVRTAAQRKSELEHGAALYTLRSIVAQVQAAKDAPHLVALVNINDTSEESTTAEQGANWYLFNDFLVRPVSEKEALSFPGSWKVPAVLIWERTDRCIIDLDSLPKEADTSLLCHDLNLAQHREPKLQRHTPLKSSELPLATETIVAIDSEFVALNQEELELSSSGSRRLIRPSRLSLARVSVLRGQGEREGEAFVDDFIWTRDEVVDYLTQFSGIKAGDLDPATSIHTLVPHKVAYKKLRMLVDLGCVFLGHGLKKDFRIINIYVPPSQVIDTVDLFQSSSHPRKLSLRFLAWFLLKQDIQGPQAPPQPAGATSAYPEAPATTAAAASSSGGSSSTSEGHDSIEDALAALRLYRLYQVFKRDNRLEDVLEDLYEAGRIHGWKPPPPQGQSGTGP